MTTFTTDDRKEAEKEPPLWESKKEPIPFAGMVEVEDEENQDAK